MSEKKELSFEEAMARLEEIVKSLENGTAPLDKSLEIFEEGTSLVRQCTKMLDTAEKKIKVLTGNEDEVNDG